MSLLSLHGSIQLFEILGFTSVFIQLEQVGDKFVVEVGTSYHAFWHKEL